MQGRATPTDVDFSIDTPIDPDTKAPRALDVGKLEALLDNQFDTVAGNVLVHGKVSGTFLRPIYELYADLDDVQLVEFNEAFAAQSLYCARELGVDLLKVGGSGAKGRITHEDVQGYVKTSLAAPAASAAATAGGSGIPPIPAVDFAQFGSIEAKPLARIRKLSAAHLQRSWLNVPHVTQTDEADITELEAFRKATNEEAGKDGVKLTLLPFIMKAVVKAIDRYPEFASSLSPDGENLVMKQYRHIGFAADTPNGLVVPVVRDVERKGLAALAAETGELAARAREGKLKGEEMRGGVFSISSLGGIGGSHFTPIVNAPEVAILGVSKGLMKPVWDGRAFQPRLMVPLSLSYDHRVIDGAYAARFIVLLVRLLSDMRRLAL
ncbi:MAG: hypothetical protein NVS9B10_20240 [Nevskia sp.]